MYHLVDFKTKSPVQPRHLIFTGENDPWEVETPLEQIKSTLHLGYYRLEPPCFAKYLPFLPIHNSAHFTSLNEPVTPLIKNRFLGLNKGCEIYFKMEGRNPTGSFKDRGSAVDVSIARELDARALIVASTGNMAASCACYCAIADIPCFVLIPEGIPIAKLSQVVAYGAHVLPIKGSYNQAATLARSIAEEKNFYLSGDYAFRVEGQKTAAYELVDQLHFDEPDMVIIPMGCGTNIASYYKGFKEYQAIGLIKKIPQLIGVQAEGACAIVNSFEHHLEHIEALKTVNTLASAIAIAFPIDGIKALEAIYQTNGAAIKVSDEEILKAQFLLSSKEGLFVESSSAATVAALLRLLENNSLRAKKIVCVMTGEGLKDPSTVLKSVKTPQAIDPILEKVAAVIDTILTDPANNYPH